MRMIEAFRNSANDSTAFVNGYNDGQAARTNTASLTAYLRVGIDDYARGYRAGYFARAAGSASTPERTVARQVVNL